MGNRVTIKAVQSTEEEDAFEEDRVRASSSGKVDDDDDKEVGLETRIGKGRERPVRDGRGGGKFCCYASTRRRREPL